MRKVIRIDVATGLFVEDVIIKDHDPTPENCIETPCADGFNLPKWDGSKWVEGYVPVIDEETKNLQYKDLVVLLIRERYSADDEFDLHNDVTDALATGAPELPPSYVEYRTYVESCKDTAYMEVYGIERT